MVSLSFCTSLNPLPSCLKKKVIWADFCCMQLCAILTDKFSKKSLSSTLEPWHVALISICGDPKIDLGGGGVGHGCDSELAESSPVPSMLWRRVLLMTLSLASPAQKTSVCSQGSSNIARAPPRLLLSVQHLHVWQPHWKMGKLLLGG